jgi:hypothetical protein
MADEDRGGGNQTYSADRERSLIFSGLLSIHRSTPVAYSCLHENGDIPHSHATRNGFALRIPLL